MLIEILQAVYRLVLGAQESAPRPYLFQGLRPQLLREVERIDALAPVLSIELLDVGPYLLGVLFR